MRSCLLTFLIAALVASPSWAVNGRNLALRSSGDASGNDWQLNANGYVGTYITVAEPTSVTLTVQAAGVTSGGEAPNMNVVVGDHRASFIVAPDFSTYTTTVTLPPGTHFVRTEVTNSFPDSQRPLTVRSLTASGTGVAIANQNSNANALAAANTYIEHFRRGHATVQFNHAAPGTPVKVDLVRHAFNFGGTISGFTSSSVLTPNPAPGSDAAKFQQFVTQNFNTLVPSNAGKWAHNEPTPGNLTMGLVDNILDFAESNHQAARMHTLIWDTIQQPTWVRSLMDQAAAGNTVAKAQLRQAISNRIQYYVGDRGMRYEELDVLNESLHQRRYWDIFGAEGVADIYSEVAAVAAAAGNPSLRLYLNEYNVLQWSSDRDSGDSDPYANWYRQNVEDVRQAGGAVTGIGVQYYADGRTSDEIGNNIHSPARITQALQNLAVVGLPISLTEFGLAEGTDLNVGAQMMDDTMRLVFGSPDATTFMIWGWWAPPDSTAPAALVDADYNLTPMGQRWQAIMDEWNTDLSLIVDVDGTIHFTGFYGDYDITIDGQTYRLSLEKGVEQYVLHAPEPAGIALMSTGGLFVVRRRRTCRILGHCNTDDQLSRIGHRQSHGRRRLLVEVRCSGRYGD